MEKILDTKIRDALKHPDPLVRELAEKLYQHLKFCDEHEKETLESFRGRIKHIHK